MSRSEQSAKKASSSSKTESLSKKLSPVIINYLNTMMA